MKRRLSHTPDLSAETEEALEAPFSLITPANIRMLQTASAIAGVENMQWYDPPLSFSSGPQVYKIFASRTGGMSNVYYAFRDGDDPSPKNWLTIKVVGLGEDFADLEDDKRFKERFALEREFLRRRKGNPYWVQILDDEIDDTHYTMEFLHGHDLDNLVEHENPNFFAFTRTPEFAAAVIFQVTAGLLAVVEERSVLRDLSSKNIRISTPKKNRGFVTQFDPGIFTGKRFRPRQLTPPGTVAGTPCTITPESWMLSSEGNDETSPKRWSGDVLDERNDVYALGCVGHHMLFGEYPFDSAIEKAFEEIQERTGKEVDVETAVDFMAAASFLGQVPRDALIVADPELGELIAEMLAKDPNERPSVRQVFRKTRDMVRHSQYRDWVGPAIQDGWSAP